jgi:ABC-type sugar transport system ATPase subunit
MAEALRLKCASLKAPVKSLSGGNQQKVVISKWLIASSKIILMDEPTRGIDVGAKEEIYALIRQLAAEGKSVLFVSSELEEVQRVSDRILVLRAGRIVKELGRNAGIEEMMQYAT